MRRDRAPKPSIAPSEIEGELDLGALGRALWKKRRWIVLPTILAALIAFGAVNMLTPRYLSEARVLIESRETAYSRPEIDRTAVERDRAPLDAEALQSQVQIFQSRDLARKVARELKLAELKEFNSESSAHQMMTALLALVGFSGEPSRKSLEERVLERYYERLAVYQIEKSRVVAVDFQSEDAELAAKVANAIGVEYLAMQEASKRDAMKQASLWLATEIERLRARVGEAEAKVEDFRSRSNLYVGNNNNQLGTQSLGELNTQLINARSQKADFESRARFIRDLLKSGKPIEAADITNSELIRRLVEQRVALKAQLAEQSSTLLPQHPRIKELTAQIGDLDSQIRGEAEKLVRSLENDARIANARVETLSTQLDQLKQQQSALGNQDVQLRALEREAKAQRDLLESYLARYRDVTARDTPDAVPADARIISQAVASSTPHFPKKLPIVAVAAIGMFMFALALAAMGELLGGEVYRPVEAARPSSPPLEAPARAPSSLAATPANVQSRLAEVADQMQRLGRGIFLVSGAGTDPSSGRIAVHLARDLAASGARTLFLDLDPDAAPSAALLPEPRVAGLSDLLTGAVHFGDVIHRDRASRVHVIAPGRAAASSEALLAGERLSVVLGALSQTYDYVVAATPALSMLRGAERLARFARATIVIAGEGDDAAASAEASRLETKGFAHVKVAAVADTPPDRSGGRVAA
ncbi:MAG TPA: exopolysaccharide transport family protein [Xanthobacteraceae bacterium]|nr:exopolysaccharide transport family protein [Xanthobacteraceae bacterium]